MCFESVNNAKVDIAIMSTNSLKKSGMNKWIKIL